MSGQTYVDILMEPGVLAHAAVIQGADGPMKVGGPSAASAGFRVSTGEAQTLANAFRNSSHVQSSGFQLAGVHYEVVRADARSIYGKKRGPEGGGVIAVKTDKVFLIGTYDKSEQHETAASVVESLADPLIGQGE
jgi:hypothetical protein